MKTYIVITTDGTTQDEWWTDSEMCQVIGRYKAPTAEVAAEMARRDLTRWKYVYPSLRVYELVSFDAYDTHGTFRDEDL